MSIHLIALISLIFITFSKRKEPLKKMFHCELVKYFGSLDFRMLFGKVGKTKNLSRLAH